MADPFALNNAKNTRNSGVQRLESDPPEWLVIRNRLDLERDGRQPGIVHLDQVFFEPEISHVIFGVIFEFFALLLRFPDPLSRPPFWSITSWPKHNTSNEAHARRAGATMTKKKPMAVPVRKFFGKYYSAIQKGHAAEERQMRSTTLAGLVEAVKKGEFEAPRWISPAEMWREVGEWWPVRLLREAAEEGDSEGSKRLLDYFMKNLGVQLPKGVLVPFRWRRGRPNETEGIYEAWIAKGRPKMTWRVCDDLAKAFYGSEFIEARSDPRLSKRLRDRVRLTILRHQLAATKSTRIS